MIEFLHGPANGEKLSLSRAPKFLRVVIDQAGKVDALDQLDDEVRDGETVYVYRIDGQAGSGVMCSRGRGCQRFLSARYLPHSEQPPQELLRDNDAWRTWAMSQEPCE